MLQLTPVSYHASWLTVGNTRRLKTTGEDSPTHPRRRLSREKLKKICRSACYNLLLHAEERYSKLLLVCEGCLKKKNTTGMTDVCVYKECLLYLLNCYWAEMYTTGLPYACSTLLRKITLGCLPRKTSVQRTYARPLASLTSYLQGYLYSQTRIKV